MYKVEIYTDGSADPNPGYAGYAAVLIARDESNRVVKEAVVSGNEAHATNNRMELMAAIAGLSALKSQSTVTVYSDSQYLVKTMTDGWRRSKNQELWQQLDELSERHTVTFEWVRGHNGNYYNEWAHREAEKQMQLARRTAKP
jgi:ribonuclease HI